MSYETINCSHDACQQDISCFIPGTAHWVCKQRRGLTSLLIGSLKALRVKYYKYIAKDKTLPKEEQDLYSVVEQALKVILNASYGVMGFDQFPLYCLPVADGTTAYGRNKTQRTIAQAETMGTPVLASDTDSLFLHNPTKQMQDDLIKWAEDNVHVDLEIDKTYRYVVFSSLKKNYLGVFQDGKTDIKGLTGKKSNTPMFIRTAFKQILECLGAVQVAEDFPAAKAKIKQIVQKTDSDLHAFKIPVSDLAVSMALNKNVEKYVKNVPQHVRAAKMLIEKGYQVKVGDRIAFIKTREGVGDNGVMPAKLANPYSINLEKYTETMQKVFEQVLLVLEVDLDTMLDKPKQKTLEQTFWGS